MADIHRYSSIVKRYRLMLPDRRTHLVFWPLLAGGLALDLWTKKAVFTWLRYGESFPLIKGFAHLMKALNDGAAFSIFAGKPFLLTLVSAVAMLVIVAVFLSSGRQHPSIHVALGLFAAGVCGNLYDRIFNDGLVRDFIDVVYWPGRHWPTFNVADSLLCIGVGLLVVSALVTPKSVQTRGRQQK